MRVLLITNDYPPKPGGIQQYLGNLVAAFGGEVRVAAPADEGDDPRVVRHERTFLWPTRPVRRLAGGADRRPLPPTCCCSGRPTPWRWRGPPCAKPPASPTR